MPYARLDYVKEFKDNAETARACLANDPFDAGADAIAPFEVRTEHNDSQYVVWSVGMHAQFIRGFAAYADYRSVVGLDDLKLNEISVGMRYETKF